MEEETEKTGDSAAERDFKFKTIPLPPPKKGRFSCLCLSPGLDFASATVRLHYYNNNGFGTIKEEEEAEKGFKKVVPNLTRWDRKCFLFFHYTLWGMSVFRVSVAAGYLTCMFFPHRCNISCTCLTYLSS